VTNEEIEAEVVEAFISKGRQGVKEYVQRVGLSAFDGWDQSILGIAYCSEEWPSLVRALVKAGIDPDHQSADGDGMTLLMSAAAKNDVDLIRFLLAHGANMDARNSDGETPLGYALSWRSIEAAECLINAGANLYALEGNGDGATPLLKFAEFDTDLYAEIERKMNSTNTPGKE